MNIRPVYLSLVLSSWFLSAASSRAATVAATFNAATEVPVTAAAYTATGNTVEFALNFAPATGTTLTVVNNTGLDFITGTFSNLAQGELVELTYGGLPYKFVANYFGGSGNDLVLQWAATRAMAWGHNSTGQLGNGGTTQSDVAVAVNMTGSLSNKTVIAVTGGSPHSLALCSDGTVAAWGKNYQGQLGNDSTAASDVPVAVSTAVALSRKTVIAVAAGANHNLALCSDGTVASWGYNLNGQLGNGSTADSHVPVAVDLSGVLSGKTVVAVAAGYSHSLVLCSDGTLAAWGDNADGNLGNGSTVQSNVPVTVNMTGALSGKTVIAVAAGLRHSLVLCSDGTVAAWGRGLEGQLGNGSAADSHVPVAVSMVGVLTGRAVIAVSAGYLHSLALCADGTLTAWGDNTNGKLGNGTTTQSNVPLAVSTTGVLSSKMVVAMSAGTKHSLALCSDGTLAAWGNNDAGQLGNGNTTDNHAPVAVSTATLAVGEKFTAGTSTQNGFHSLVIVALPAVPRIAVEQPGGVRLGSSDSGVDFGSSTLGNGMLKTFTIRNDGILPLAIASAIIDGTNAADFVLTSPPAASVNAGSSTTFAITFTASAGFNRSAALHVTSNDPNIRTFHLNLTATVTGVLTASYITGTEVPLSASGFTATGSSVNFTLNGAPVTGTTLTVVRNTGPGLITGTFSNLQQGEIVALSYGGVPYNFVANYFGGNGNDLVLQWAATRPIAWGDNGLGQLGNGNTTRSYVPVAVNTAGVFSGKTIISMIAGSSHSMGLCSDGSLAAWGDNEYGMLGDGTRIDSPVPVAVNMAGVLSGKTVVAMAAGSRHSLALCSDGTLAAWGYNYSGELGNGGTTSSNVPVAVDLSGVLSGKTVVAVAAGYSYSLVLCSDGTLAAWGANSDGQLGNGTTVQSNVPVRVIMTGVLSGKTVIAVAAGTRHNLALCSDGTLTAWGYNDSGVLGDGSTADSHVPVAVDLSGVLSGKTVVAMAAGYSHSLALCSDGTLAGWGSNDSGELGNGSWADSPAPVAVSTAGVLSGKVVIAVAAGDGHSVALCSDATLGTWGGNGYGQLGIGNTTASNVPVPVSTVMLAAGENLAAAAIASSAFYSLGIVAVPPPPQVVIEQPAGTGLISGSSNVHFVGDFKGAATSLTFTVRNSRGGPLTVSSVTFDGVNGSDFSLSVPPAGAVVAGSNTTFVVSFAPDVAGDRNAVMHIVSNDPLCSPFDVTLTGTAGINSTLDAFYTTGLEVPLSANSFTATSNSVNFKLNFAPVLGTQLMVVQNTGLGFIRSAFTNLSHGQIVPLTYAGTTYNFVANYYGGTGNDLVLQWADVRLLAWGSNNGALGNNSTTSSPEPVGVTTTGVLSGKTVIALAAGDDDSLALCADGTMAAWGFNYHGESGNGSSTQSKVPVAVDQTGVLSGKRVIAISAGYGHNLALCSDGVLAAWGNNISGELGNGSTTDSKVPVAVDQTGALAGKTVIAVAAGYSHSLALCSDGTVAAWGSNYYDQLGNGGGPYSSVPVAVSTAGVLAGRTVIAVASGKVHSLALCSDGTLATWGWNRYGQLGNGSTVDSNVPVAVDRTGALVGKTVIAITAGGYHNLALCSDGTAVAWGSNNFGQVGNRSTPDSHVPVVVDQTGVLSGKTVVAVAAGYGHCLALCSDGTLVAWGYNILGQLGNNSATDSHVPVTVSMAGMVSGGRFVTAVTGQGANHSLSLVAEPPAPRIAVDQPAGTNLMSGSSTVDFGIGTIGTGVSRIFIIKNVGTIDLGGFAVTFDGSNGSDFRVTTAPAATVVPDASTTFTVTFAPGSFATRNGVMHIASNDPLTGSFTVNLTGYATGALAASYSTGKEVPFSASSFTATGNTVNFTLNYPPSTGTTLTVVKNTGRGFIQGYLGNLAQGQRIALSYGVSTYYFVADYYGGTGNDLVLRWANTKPLAWGNNISGQLGDNSTTQHDMPTGVATDGWLSDKTVISMAAGASHSVALCSDGTLAAWGNNDAGQLGNGNTTPSQVPVAVDQTGALAGKTVIAIAAGASHHLALCSDGRVAAWGRGLEGQLGNGGTASSNVPVAVSGASALSGKAVVAIAAGAFHSMALCSDGTVAAWGGNQFGQLGDNTTIQRSVPIAVNTASGLSALAGRPVVAIAAGEFHSLALISSGGPLTAWGSNQYGQLGDNTTTQRMVPVAVGAAGISVIQGRTVTAIAAGQSHSLALCSDGTLAAWGLNNNGQLGDNTTTQRNAPVWVSRATGLSALAGLSVVAVTAGYRHNMALCADGTMAAWGLNGNGQLGDHSTTQRNTPTAVSVTGQSVGGCFVTGTSGLGASHSLGIVAEPFVPQIVVECPTGNGLIDGGSTVDFGKVADGGNASRTFTIRNPGNTVLNSLFIDMDGMNADEFTLGGLGTTSLAPGASTTFTVTFAPSGSSAQIAALHIVSNALGRTNPFDINLVGGLTQYEQWRLTYFQTIEPIGNAADTATPRNDGIVNLIKFATGMNPTQAGTMPGTLGKSDVNLVFSYSRSKAAVSDGFTFTVEWSDTLAPGSWSRVGVSETASDQGDTHLVTATLPVGPGPGRFARLRVNPPQ